MLRLAVACFVIVLFAAASCSGQDAVEQRSSTLKNQDNTAAIGEIVTELGDKITVVFQDSNDHYWFGGGKKGVYKYDGKTLTVFSIQDGLCSHSILGIQEDRLGNIFFDTLKGVSKFDGKKFTTLKVTVPESSNSEWKLEPDDLWFRMGWDKNGSIA